MRTVMASEPLTFFGAAMLSCAALMDGDQAKPRIRISDLAPREKSPERMLGKILQRLGAPEGAPCQATCDCQIGLICRNGHCLTDW